MIPQRLVMEGVYSYQRRVEIDFTALAGAQLFGIFGPVGSGKSSILEAMTLALFGKTARLKRNERVYENMLNLRSNTLWVSFDFIEGESSYRFTIEANRDPKRPTQVKTAVRHAYRIVSCEPEELEPLGHTDGEQILGLSYENFGRTTIIPQGKFQEFLQLTPSDRTAMMKELFALHRFDLAAPTSRLVEANKRKLDVLNGRLSEIDPSCGTQLEEARDEKRLLEEKIATLEARRETLNEAAHRMEHLSHVAGELERWERGARQLAEQREEIERYRREVSLLEAINEVVRPPFEELTRAEQSLAEARSRRKELGEELIAVSQKRDELARTLADHQLESQRSASVQALSSALDFVAERVDIEERHRRTGSHHEEVASRVARRREESEGLATWIEAHREGLPARAEIEELRHVVEVERTIARLREKDQQRRCRAWDDAGLEARPLPEVEELIRVTTEEIAVQHRLEREESLRAPLQALQAELIPGRPCPVCGSLDHPLPLYSDRTVAWDKERLIALEQTCRRLETLRTRLEGIEDSVQGYPTAPPRPVITMLGPAGVPEEDVALLERQIGVALTVWNEIDARQARLEKITRENERDVLELSTLTERLSGEKSELTRIAVQVENLGALMDEAAKDELERIEPKNACARAEAIRSHLDEIGRTTAHLTEEKTRVEAQYASVVAGEQERMHAVAHAEDRVEEVTERLSRAMDELASRGHGEFSSRELSELVERVGQLDRYRSRLTDFTARLTEVESHRDEYRLRVETLWSENLSEPLPTKQGVLDMESVSRTVAAEAKQISTRYASCNDEHSSSATRMGVLSTRIASLTEKMERKKDLESKRRKELTRQENLATLATLFRSKGFVAYVAQVYLEQLARIANARFRSLTHNQLELVLRGDREFAVIDYLGGGRRRSVKTLSGGQTFQASLCLALALVDSIAGGRGDGQNPAFFFLDEGFGSLDEEALHEVFTTLKRLRAENRIIGVISHVPSMQEEIEVGLRIARSEDEGSTIHPLGIG